MAKKSAKKISISVDKLVYCVAAVLGLAALLLIFAPAASLEYSLFSGTFKGTELVFGVEDAFVFSFLNLLTYLLLLGGIVMLVLKLVGAKSKLFDLLGAGLLIAAGVMFFLVAAFALPIKNSLCEAVYQYGTVHLLVGPILAAVFSLLSGAGILCYALLGKK